MKKYFLLVSCLFIASLAFGGEVEDIERQTLARENLTKVRPYCRPTSSDNDAVLYVQTQNASNATICIENAMTKERVYFDWLNANESFIDLNGLEEGIYLIRVKSNGVEHYEYLFL